MLKRLELPTSAWPELKQHAEERGLMFLSTPDDLDSARLLRDLGVSALKVGSAELTNRPFLRDLARLGLPLILSTGMGSMLEVALALDAIDSVAVSTGRPVSVVLLHAVSAYPAPAGELNLRAMTSLRQAFGVPTGLSDHSLGAAAAVLGAGLGMAVLEKHLTLDRAGQGPDHAASADPAQFREMVRLLREAETMLGSGLKAPTRSEADTRSTVRRVLLYTADLPEGHVLRGQDVVALRSGVPGLPPDEADVLAGRALRRAVGAGAAVSQDDLT
jgi:N-acetylneuraminate synthase/N,N'-diacetyllegionaminate synthase